MRDRKDISFLLSGCLADLFEALGVDFSSYYDGDHEVRGTCPCHDSDNQTAFTYYKVRNLWFCWTRGCHREKGSDLVGLVASKLGKCVGEACSWAEKFLESKKITDFAVAAKLRKRSIEREKVDYWREHLTQEPFDERVLSKLKSPEAFAARRGLDPSIVKGMGAGYAERGGMRCRIVFPVRNVEGRIVGFTGRFHKLRPGKFPKWKHWPTKRFRASINLFNVDRAARHIRRTGAAIIGEGPLEVVKLEMAGYLNSVSVLGLRVTAGQVEVLKKCGTIYAVLVFDPDLVDSAQVKDNISRLRSSDFDVHVLRWEGDEDIGAMRIDKVHRVMAQAADIPTFHDWRRE